MKDINATNVPSLIGHLAKIKTLELGSSGWQCAEKCLCTFNVGFSKFLGLVGTIGPESKIL